MIYRINKSRDEKYSTGIIFNNIVIILYVTTLLVWTFCNVYNCQITMFLFFIVICFLFLHSKSSQSFPLWLLDFGSEKAFFQSKIIKKRSHAFFLVLQWFPFSHLNLIFIFLMYNTKYSTSSFSQIVTYLLQWHIKMT